MVSALAAEWIEMQYQKSFLLRLEVSALAAEWIEI